MTSLRKRTMERSGGGAVNGAFDNAAKATAAQTERRACSSAKAA
jgi:hypothetical protein